MVFHASFIVTNFDILKNAWSYRFHSKRMDTTVEYMLCCSLKSLLLIYLLIYLKYFENVDLVYIVHH